MEDQINKENLRERVDKLYDWCIQEVKDYNCISEQSKQEMDTLNDRVTQAKNYADKRCRKLRTGKIPHSKIIHEAMGKCIVLKIVQKRWILKGKRARPKSRDLKRAIKKYNFQGKYRFENMVEIEEKLQKATKQYHKLRPRASEQ
jgi:hypothetical protein